MRLLHYYTAPWLCFRLALWLRLLTSSSKISRIKVMNDELVPFFTGHSCFMVADFLYNILFFTVAMQQTLGNKNQFVKQAIKQHERWRMSTWLVLPNNYTKHKKKQENGWAGQRVTRMTYSKTDNSVSHRQSGMDFILLISFHSDWPGLVLYPNNKVRWYVRMSLCHRQFMVWLSYVFYCVYVHTITVTLSLETMSTPTPWPILTL